MRVPCFVLVVLEENQKDQHENETRPSKVISLTLTRLASCSAPYRVFVAHVGFRHGKRAMVHHFPKSPPTLITTNVGGGGGGE